MLNRRHFLRNASLGLGALMIPEWVAPKAARAMAANKTLVVLFLRGGADGLHLVVPRGDEANYIALRRNETTGQDITLPPAPSELQLDGFFEAHPGLLPLMPRWDSGELAIVHAVGRTNSYSHFTAQDAMERAEPANPTFVTDGWMHRALGVMRDLGELDGPALALSGVGLRPSVPKSLGGPDVGIQMAFPSLASFRLTGSYAAESGAALEEIYRRTRHSIWSGPGSAVFEALDVLDGVASQPPDATYPGGGLANLLKDAARLVKNPALGVKMIALDAGGWDTHSNQMNRMDNVTGDLGGALAAFWEDLGPRRSDTVFLAMTEFGRTGRVNGNGGTDHGWATTMFALGDLEGGRVLTRANPAAPGNGLPTPSGHWPGLGPGELHVQPGSNEERDLEATTDYRDVIGEVLVRFCGLPAAAVRDEVLRGYTPVYPGLFDTGGGPGPGPRPVPRPVQELDVRQSVSRAIEM